MAKLHGDFGDLSRYDVLVTRYGLRLMCQDCDKGIRDWADGEPVPLDELTRAASEHETAEETDEDGGAVPDDAVPVERLDELREHFGRR